jgi:hypothetical protein
MKKFVVFSFVKIRWFIHVSLSIYNYKIRLLQNLAKKRLHAVTVAAAACFIFPFAMFKLAVVSNFLSLNFTKVLS